MAYHQDPMLWAVPCNPTFDDVARFALACRNYSMLTMQDMNPHIAVILLSSKLVQDLLNELDPENPRFVATMQHARQCHIALKALITNPVM